MSATGLVPGMRLTANAELSELAGKHLPVPGNQGANADLKGALLVGGMVAGADSIDDMALLRHGAMGWVFEHPHAPSTLGLFLQAFTFGHSTSLTRLLPGS